MLSNAMIYPTLPATDINRAKKFYQEKIGLKVVAEDSSPGVMLQAGQNSMLYIYQRPPSHCEHTLAFFNVDNIESEVMSLKNKGVKFEEYDIPSMKIKTVNGIATAEGMKSAWFKDSEGNILGIGELTDAKMKAKMMQEIPSGVFE
jgi:predicted enzyme related to lactoylglutathione lyase